MFERCSETKSSHLHSPVNLGLEVRRERLSREVSANEDRLEDARREKLRSSRHLDTSYGSGHKSLNRSRELERSGSGISRGNKLLYSDECVLANLLIETIIKENKAEDLRVNLSTCLDFNFFDA